VLYPLKFRNNKKHVDFADMVRLIGLEKSVWGFNQHDEVE
jgi:hypothetical protein